MQKARTSEEEREAKAMGDRNKWMSEKNHLSAGRGVGTEITNFKAGVLLKKNTTFDGKSDLITESQTDRCPTHLPTTAKRRFQPHS